MTKVLPKTPDVITLSDEVLKEIYEDNEADYWIEQQKAGLLDCE